MTSSQEWHHIDRKQANILILAQILGINQIAGSLPGRKLLVESFLLNTTFPITIQILENERKYSQSRKILTIFFWEFLQILTIFSPRFLQILTIFIRNFGSNTYSALQGADCRRMAKT